MLPIHDGRRRTQFVQFLVVESHIFWSYSPEKRVIEDYIVHGISLWFSPTSSASVLQICAVGLCKSWECSSVCPNKGQNPWISSILWNKIQCSLHFYSHDSDGCHGVNKPWECFYTNLTNCIIVVLTKKNFPLDSLNFLKLWSPTISSPFMVPLLNIWQIFNFHNTKVALI